MDGCSGQVPGAERYTGTGDEQFNNPTALAVDAVNGWIYVVDQGNHRIQRFDNRLRFLLSWGSQRDGDGQFQTPGDIAIDPAGDWIYVLDKGNQRVQRFGTKGEFSRAWGVQGDGDGQFQEPGIIALINSGFIYVGEIESQLVQKFDERGNPHWEALTAVP